MTLPRSGPVHVAFDASQINHCHAFGEVEA